MECRDDEHAGVVVSWSEEGRRCPLGVARKVATRANEKVGPLSRAVRDLTKRVKVAEDTLGIAVEALKSKPASEVMNDFFEREFSNMFTGRKR